MELQVLALASLGRLPYHEFIVVAARTGRTATTERRLARAYAVMVPLICWSFSSSIFG
jgi:hypothetical protein